MYKAFVLNVFLASPSDVPEERQIAREIILDWNNIHSASRNIVLLPIGWEHNSYPLTGERPQELINKQVLRNADILIGIFWTRIGTPTGKAISGSVEEIEEHINSGKPAMLYFSKKPLNPDSINQDQYKAVKELKQEYKSKGIVEEFSEINEFKEKFQRHLALILNSEEYQFDINEISFELENDKITKNDLSAEAKILLKEASIDPNGFISVLPYIGGFTFQTNGKQLNEDYTPRTRAKWDSAIQELLNFDLIVDTNYKGQNFRLTELGYKIADSLE